MSWIGDLFSNPFYIPLICMGLIGFLGLLAKSRKARAVSKFCLTIFIIWLYYGLIGTVIMPNCGYAPDSSMYQGLQTLLYLIPIFYFVARLK